MPTRRDRVIQGAVVFGVLLFIVMLIGYVIAPVRHTLRGVGFIILLDALIVLVMYYVAAYGNVED